MSVTEPRPVVAVRHVALLTVFTASIGLSAALLFAIELIFAKVALPLLGGSPEVWNTAMVFYQATLLLGYGYAHLSVTYLRRALQIPLHLLLVAVTFVSLPIAAVAWIPPQETSPVLWLVGFLAVSIGLPFFVVSSTAPLLQRWFAATDHPAAPDPYFLYGASNLGSMIALLGYPLVLEPAFSITEQEWGWSVGYVALVVFMAICGILSLKSSRRQEAENLSLAERRASIGWRERATWTLLAFVPSSLLLGVTTYITTHIAAAPLFWVVPLALYLLTFILVFARRPIFPHRLILRLQPILLIPLALMLSGLPPSLGIAGLALHLIAFFVIAMACHGELARRRPNAAKLTEFYLWMSIGGVLGGIFNALLAPVLFNGVYEYPLALVLACLIQFRRNEGMRPILAYRDWIPPVALLILLALPIVGSWQLDKWVLLAVSVVLCGILLASIARPVRFALVFAIAVFAASSITNQFDRLLQERSFFGVNRVVLDSSGAFNLYMHGPSVHGAEHRDSARRLEQLTYYSKEGPLGQLFVALEERGGLHNVGLVGLGVATSVCFRKPDQRWTIYEIDPIVLRIARDRRYFHYLEDCAPQERVVLGDARLSLVGAKPQEFDLLILDAFSSDSIPVHLLTREAIAVYRSKLAENGVLAFHISTNRYLDLRPTLGNLAADAGLIALVQAHVVTAEMRKDDYKKNSLWVVFAASPGALGDLAADDRWKPLESEPGGRPWTDDYSNILSAMRLSRSSTAQQ